MTKLKIISAAALASAIATPVMALEEGKLIVWQGARAPELMEEIAAKFTTDLGVEVVVEDVDPLTEKFQQAAATGDGPDIVLWAHDRFGEWSAGGLITDVNPSDDIKAGVIESAWDAVTLGNKVYGYPVAVETVGLIYNKALVQTPPATFEELKELTMPEGVATIMWDYNNTYFTMPMLMANGGYAFQKVDGVYNGKETGVNNDGAMMGAKTLRSLFDDEVLKPGIDYGIMDGAMAKGDTAMVLNGPWSWAAYIEAGIDIGVAPIPTVNGKASPSFLGVQAMAINAASPNKDLAVEFIENYVMTDENLNLWNSKNALGALADKSAGAGQAEKDEKIAATLAIAGSGVPMPSNPEMGAFWSAMEPALGNITSDAATVEDALNDAAKRILSE